MFVVTSCTYHYRMYSVRTYLQTQDADVIDALYDFPKCPNVKNNASAQNYYKNKLCPPDMLRDS